MNEIEILFKEIKEIQDDADMTEKHFKNNRLKSNKEMEINIKQMNENTKKVNELANKIKEEINKTLIELKEKESQSFSYKIGKLFKRA